jgi:hypothetical protein
LSDAFTITEHTARVPRTLDSGHSWFWVPENYPDNQWKMITRHRWWKNLLCSYYATGKTEYARYLDQSIRDWCVHQQNINLLEGSKLDPGCRMDEWPRIFYSFLASDQFNDATILLMLDAFYIHGRWLADDKNWSEVNRLVTQMTGLFKVSLGFPEFKDASAWLDISERTLARELHRQILPDGAQIELSNNYHRVVVDQYTEIKELSGISGRPLPKDFDQELEKAINYAASKMFPWAGHFISRSRWDATANWAFFDVGPWGMDHQHNDKLHISIYSNGRALLSDAGRYTYKTDEWRAYFRGSQSHNVILVNCNVLRGLFYAG